MTKIFKFIIEKEYQTNDRDEAFNQFVEDIADNNFEVE